MVTFIGYERADNPSVKLKIGHYYLVPAIWTLLWTTDSKPHYKVVPVINHPHNDIENGQEHTHYHIDDRFLELGKGGFEEQKDKTWQLGADLRPVLDSDSKLDEVVLKLHRLHVLKKTPVRFISKSKLKHKCIVKGKCPHRGVDLTNVTPINGIITCPLHSLRFNAETKELIKD